MVVTEIGGNGDGDDGDDGSITSLEMGARFSCFVSTTCFFLSLKPLSKIHLNGSTNGNKLSAIKEAKVQGPFYLAV